MSADATVYVGGLQKGTLQEELARAFSPLQVIHAVISRSFGFVTFATPAEAAQAVAMKDVLVCNRPIHAALRHGGSTAGGSTASNARTTSLAGRSVSSGGGRSVFVHRISREAHALQVQAQLTERCLALGVAARVVVPRKQGGGHPPQHRGFAFLECSSAGDVAILLAGLPGAGWATEPVRKKRGKNEKRGKRSGGRRGGGHQGGGRGSKSSGNRGQHTAGAADGSEEEDGYEDDWEDEDGEEDEREESASCTPAKRKDLEGPLTSTLMKNPVPANPMSNLSDMELRALMADVQMASEGWGSHTDACVAAMASFVAESRDWAVNVQGFMVEHCRCFEATEENQLEWHELHQQLCTLIEGMLERELAKLGVAPEDFVERMRNECANKGLTGGGAAEELLDAVLAMDDFRFFKEQMLRLKADLELLNLDTDTLDIFTKPPQR